MDDFELIDYVVREIIESEFLDAKLEDFHPFQQELIKYYNFDIHNFNDIYKLSLNCRISLFINYYADAQLTILKRNMEVKNNRSFTDEEVMEMVYKKKLRFWYKWFFYSLRYLDSLDRARIYNDFAILRKIDQKNLLYKTHGVAEILEKSLDFDFRNVCDRYTTFFNIHNKYELLGMGLNDFIDDVVPLIFDMSEPCQNNSLFPFMLWKDKKVKSLKKD